ncbi:leucyl-tRNA synthetase, cytoplasmic, putative [Entamoeba invadens IP1]|uniref:leucyl-tRNA synthetase, cytoplasmic, putative n=1 Tax=Entamoeba invadens IP1 TaxID=370355 RepID=UPI0002C3D659|nr:leucyl-tRNA synthetase, cytoplasmic, putative [Entamoeba invadens IP1]ELP85013.1 leucyl-tRNA synthetase, cytoplasmic, putative [Entamoeba invadens IP1]|eukprot:XP_004184359.1 leucyl-tRNA synthetase, cytoplasmic, putative [Entamoeba invadens IP1]
MSKAQTKDNKVNKAEKPRSTAKRDELAAIEKEMTTQWEANHLYETGELNLSQKKFMPTFPFPYMNGRLHLGHTFTLTKAEFAARYHKLKGEAVVFPFGFHCTGMPIKACADKLKNEIEKYGCPPVFKDDEEVTETKTVRAVEAIDAHHSNKAKAKQKGGKHQWDILKSNGIPESDIPKFVDPLHWLEYFPTCGVEDLKLMGLAVDWRRSFITTDHNKFYDSFVQWQFWRLKNLGKILFGKRYTIYSPLDGQPCADHDRSSGEGVLPQEYTAIKMKVLETKSELVNKFMKEGKSVFLIAGTLRPETMYGQTNCWIHPDIEYHLFEMKNGEIVVCTQRCGNNLVYQELLKAEPVNGKAVTLGSVKGSELLGAALKAPLTSYEKIYTLPMTTILEDKGTGIVTSVPSDSPDDYMNIFVLKNKPEYRKKLNVEDKWVVPFDLIEICEIPELGKHAAKTVCEQMKIKSPNDRTLLDEAKEKVYTQGFYNGVLTVGKYAGQKIKDAKTPIRAEMIEAGEAFVYSEPTAQVISRSGDECVVSLCDQWYITYGEENWKNETLRRLETMETFHNSTRETLKHGLNWMNQWACSRNFGLGTLIPWDKRYLIESLSDSTIYMAYYTIAHFLQGNLNGTKEGLGHIKPEQMIPTVWDYIFNNGEFPKDTTIPKETLEAMKKEFEYWYPFDVRVTGKDLLTNHCLFCLYTHTALFGEEKFPKGMRANGHLLINNEKMAKSTGNFLSLTEGIEKYTSDGMRIGLADAGDGVEDANFAKETADTGLLRLHTLLQWIKEMLQLIKDKKCKEGVPSTFEEKAFDARINNAVLLTDAAYEKMLFREALHKGFYELILSRDSYVAYCETVGIQMNATLLMKFIEVQIKLLYPIAPHFSDYVWRDLLGNKTFLWNEKYPEICPVDQQIVKESEYLDKIIYKFRTYIDSYCHPKAKKGTKAVNNEHPKHAEIFVGTITPVWQIECAKTLKGVVKMVDGEVVIPAQRDLAGILCKNEIIKKNSKKAMSFAMMLVENVKKDGVVALDISIQFDEVGFLKTQIVYLQKLLKIEEITVVAVEKEDEKLIPGEPLMTNFK